MHSAFLVREKGFEPPTFWFVAKHSIQLSYWRIHSFFDYAYYFIIFFSFCQEFF